MNRHQLQPRQWIRSAAALAVALLLFHGAARAQEEKASASTTACGASIAVCGCTITKAGTYTVTADLSSGQGLTAAGDCIAIKASNAILDVHEYSVTGPGLGTSTGAGIDVLKSSSGAFIEGGGSVSSGWKYGLEVQGKNTISDWVEPDGNVVGIFLNGATGANINNFDAIDNSVYGVWIQGGKGNQVNAFASGSNTGTGVYIGCHDDDTHGTKCAGVKPSSGNRIYDFNAESNGDAGIVIDLGNEGNVITDVHISGNAGGVDSIDENPSCGTDQWIQERTTTVFGVTSQSCIP
ncbi:right-handed parallel beta-helix repeat-containing protein [Candidatus Binatus sp.]|uniref:right-handed parallel beta-helix repeat-containing protein n=1 Tax=Candidatus Binatus sp. TaxID=2811406 RepID=UPI002F92803E